MSTQQLMPQMQSPQGLPGDSGLPWVADQFLGGMLSNAGGDLTQYIFTQLGIGGADLTSQQLAAIEGQLQQTNTYLQQLDTDIKNMAGSLAAAISSIEAQLSFQMTGEAFTNHIVSVTSPWSQLMTLFAGVDPVQWSTSATYRATTQTVYQETIKNYVDLAQMASDMDWIATEMSVNVFTSYDQVYYHQVVDQSVRAQYTANASGQLSIDYSTIGTVQLNAYAALHASYAYVTSIQAQGLYLQQAYITATQTDATVIATMIGNAVTTFFEQNQANWMSFLRAAEEVSMLSNGYYLDNVALGTNAIAPLFGGGTNTIRTYANQVRCAGSGLGACLTVELIVPWDAAQNFDASAWNTSATALSLAYQFAGLTGSGSSGTVNSRLMVTEDQWATPQLSYTFDGTSVTRQYWTGWTTTQYVPRLVFDIPLPANATTASIAITTPSALSTSYANALAANGIDVTDVQGTTFVQSSPDRYGVSLFYGIQALYYQSWEGASDMTGFTVSQGAFAGSGSGFSYSDSPQETWQVTNFNAGAWIQRWQLQPPYAQESVIGNVLSFYSTWNDSYSYTVNLSVVADSIFQWGGATWWGIPNGPNAKFSMVTSAWPPGVIPSGVGVPMSVPIQLIFVNQTSTDYTLTLGEDDMGGPAIFTWPQPAASQYTIPANGQLTGLKILANGAGAVLVMNITAGGETRSVQMMDMNLWVTEITPYAPLPEGISVGVGQYGDSMGSFVIGTTITSE